jgi:serine protease Do
MTAAREKIVIVAADSEWRRTAQSDLEEAGYDVLLFESSTLARPSLHAAPPQLLVVDLTSEEAPPPNSGAAASGDPAAPASPSDPTNGFHEMLPALKGSAETRDIRVIVLAALPAERATILDLGADAVLSPPWDRTELLARVRGQLRARREIDDLRQKVAIAQQGQQIAHTAFEALAVTEKMTKDAFSLGRALKLAFIGICVAAALMAVVFFLFSHNATKQMKLANAAIGRLERGVIHQGDLLAEVHKLRSENGSVGAPLVPEQADLQQKAADLKQKMATSDASSIPDLQKQLAETNARLQRVEGQRDTAQTVITSDVASVCLLHVAVSFRDKDSGERIRYAGINPQGEPLQDSDGHPIYTIAGRGPEVRLDAFGTGFLASPGGRALTNRHVAQPWWKDDDLGAMINQGVQPEISSITAYFPGNPAALHAEIEKISSESDLASMQIAMNGLTRPVLPIDAAKNAAISGQSVISIGYATGLAAILARADEDTVQKIMKDSGGDVAQILDELSRRGLIHPLITQGHIGDVLDDKIVFDAQTTHGGSGGPLLNRDGKVIGVTFAVLSGFGGSNFGIPIRFSGSVLSAAPKQ